MNSQTASSDWQKLQVRKVHNLVLEILADGEWHSILEIACRLRDSIAPEYLAREYEKRRPFMYRRTQRTDELRSLDGDTMVMRGARWMVARTMCNPIRRGLFRVVKLNGLNGYQKVNS